MISVQEDSSKDAPTPNMLPSFWSSSPWPIDVHVSIVGFRVQNMFEKKNYNFEIVFRSKSNWIITSHKNFHDS
jgi:hypothetical protein